MSNINYPAIVDVDMAFYPTPTEQKVKRDTVILADKQDLMAIKKAISEDRVHATGKSVIVPDQGAVDIGNIRNIHYNTLEEYKDYDKGDKRYLVVIKEDAVKGSVVVAPHYEDLGDRNRMFAYKNALIVGVYQKNSAEEALTQAANDIEVGSEILRAHRLY